MYTATVLLRRTEKQFWRMTPRKLNSLVKAHIKANNPEPDDGKDKPTTGFIDQIF
jgi:hypothetical protein